jgi:hypothetical protein
MRTTSLKTVYLTEDELKQAIVEYLEKEHEELAQHLHNNECEMVWGQNSKEFLVSIDGEIEEKKTITTENLAGVVMCEECSGGNTTERVEEQTARLEKIAEQKEINKVVDQVESAAIKAVHKVMEQHNKALEKLAESEE